MNRPTSFRFPNFARALRDGANRIRAQHRDTLRARAKQGGAHRTDAYLPAHRRALVVSTLVAGLALVVAGVVSLPGSARAEPVATFSLS